MVKLVITSIAAFLLEAACMPVAADLDTGNPDQLGPFAVGLKQAILAGAQNPTGLFCPYADSSRVLPVDVWYPSNDDTTSLPPATINFGFLLQGVFNDLTPIDEARPLVVFSHGNFGTSFDSFFIAQALASHGFVVAVPSHVGNTAADVDPAMGTADPECKIRNDRPRDISAVITCMLNPLDPNLILPPVDGDAIAVAGHSLGSFTAFTAAGGFAGRMDSPCESALPYDADPRVKAIVPISLFIDDLVSDEIESIDVPTLFLSGTADIVTPVPSQTDPAWERLSTQQAYRVDIVNAGHTSFTNTCDFLAYLSFLVTTFPNDFTLPLLLCQVAQAALNGCPDEAYAAVDPATTCIVPSPVPPLIDVAEAQRITLLYMISFLKKIIAGQGAYTRFLTRGYVNVENLPVELSADLGAR